MSKKKQSSPVWFRMFANLRPLVEAVPDDAAGAALKAAFAYFVDGAEPKGLDTLALALFRAIRPSIDDSIRDYRQTVERGRKAVQTRWDTKAYKGIQGVSGCIQGHTETEEEKEIEKDIDTEVEPSPALLREQDFNRRRQQAIRQLRSYTGA